MKQKFDKKTINFILLQAFLISFFIFLSISILLNASFVLKIDNFIFKVANVFRNIFINNFMLVITLFGEFITIVIALLILLIIKKRSYFYPLLALTSLSAVLNFCLKHTICRLRPAGQFVQNLFFNYPFPNGYAFPSGHSQTAFVFYFILTYILLNNFYNGKHKKLYLTLATIFCVLIMLSRIVLGVHYFSDILAGAILAIIIITNYIYFSKKQI